MDPSRTGPSSPLRRPVATLLTILSTALLASALAQHESASIERLRVLDAETGAEVAILADGGTLDLTDSGVRSVILEPLDVSDATRSVAFTLGDGAPTVLNAAPFVLGAGATEVATVHVEFPVLASEDDAEEFSDASLRDPEEFPAGFTYHTSSDLDLGLDPNHSRQVIGIRFAELDIPSDATVEAATIVFTADGASSGRMTVRLTGERSTASQRFPQGPFRTGTFDISTRDRTFASTTWLLEEPWQSRNDYATPDVAPIVREVIGLPGWEPGSPITFIIEGQEGEADALRRAFSYDGRRGVDSRIPRLTLTLTVPSTRAAAPLVVPADGTNITVTPHGRFDASGAAGAPLHVELRVASSTVAGVDPTPAPPAPVPVPVPVPDRSAEPGPAPEPGAAPPPDDAAAPASLPDVAAAVGSVTPLWDSGVRGSLYLERAGPSAAVVTIALDAPTSSPLRVSVRSGTCAAPGDVLIHLEPIPTGADRSTTEAALSPTALRFGGFIVFISSGTPVACGPLGP